MPGKWRGEFRAKTVVEEMEVELSIAQYSERCPRIRDIVENLLWHLARIEKDPEPPFFRRKIKNTTYWLGKVEINIPGLRLQHIGFLFTEEKHQIRLLGIKFYDSGDSETGDLA